MGLDLLRGLGAAKPVSEFINTAQTFQHNERQGQIQQMQLGDLQRRQEDEARLIDLDDIQTKFGTIGQGEMGKALKAYAETLAPLHEVPAPDGTVKRFVRKGDFMASLKDMDALTKNAPNHVLAITWGSYLDRKAKVSALQADAAKGRPVSPEALATAQREANEILVGYTEMRRAQEGKDPTKPAVYKPGDYVQQPDGSFQQMPEKAPARLTPIYDPDSPTGWTYGNPATGELTEGAFAPAPKDSSAPRAGELRKFHEGDREVTEEWNGSGWVPKSAAPRYKPGDGTSGKLDYEGAKSLIKTLPKLKEEAVSASGNVQRIDTMTGLLDKGLGGGRLNQAKAWLAPWAEAAGMDVRGLSEAQTYELLAQTLGGSMRMAIVGPGQVSNFEQQMLNRVNAGGKAATPAARELLKYYRDIAARKVADYNDSVDSVAIASPGTAKLYKKITVGGSAAGSVTTAEDFLRKKGLR